jgi:hypothetical protein
VIEALVFAAVSTLLYHLGMGFILFLIPLQVVLVRKGRKSFAISSGLALILILVVKLLLLGRTQGPAAFLIVEIATVLSLMGGLVLIQMPELSSGFERYRLPRVLRLLISTGVAGVVSVPVILYLRGNEEFLLGMQELFSVFASNMNRAFSEAEAFNLLSGSGMFQAESLMKISSTFLLRSYLFDYFLLLAFSWWLGTVIGARTVGKKHGLTRVADFKLPDTYVWPLIVSLGLVLGTLLVPVEFLEILAWNSLLILVFLYGVAGLGILRFLLKKLKIPMGFRWLLILAIIILAMTPRINFIILILVPGLGVSETWLKYRREERSKV